MLCGKYYTPPRMVFGGFIDRRGGNYNPWVFAMENYQNQKKKMMEHTGKCWKMTRTWPENYYQRLTTDLRMKLWSSHFRCIAAGMWPNHPFSLSSYSRWNVSARLWLKCRNAVIKPDTHILEHPQFCLIMSGKHHLQMVGLWSLVYHTNVKGVIFWNMSGRPRVRLVAVGLDHFQSPHVWDQGFMFRSRWAAQK